MATVAESHFISHYLAPIVGARLVAMVYLQQSHTRCNDRYEQQKIRGLTLT